MKTLVLYDSAYGNTERIATTIGNSIPGDVKVLRIKECNPLALGPIDFLFVGSPTYSGRPTPAMRDFLDSIPASALNRVCVAAFDTRYSSRWVGIIGYAAGRMADSMKAKGATMIASPQGFFVSGKEGPLKEGELERAATWAKETVKSLDLAKV